MIAPPTSRPFKACRAMSDLRLLSRRTRGRTCRKKTDDKWHVAVASAQVGRATAAEAAARSDVAAPRVGPRLLLHVRQKSMWRIDRGARET